MNKVIIIFIMMLVLGCGFSSASWACYETAFDIPKKNKEEILSQAYAVGMFKVVRFDKDFVTYETLAPYNQFIEKEIVVKRAAPKPCSPGPYTNEKYIYDLIILKQDNEFFLSEINMKAEDWDNLRKGIHFGRKYQLVKRYCELSGGDWYLQKDWGFPLHYCVKQKD